MKQKLPFLLHLCRNHLFLVSWCVSRRGNAMSKSLKEAGREPPNVFHIQTQEDESHAACKLQPTNGRAQQSALCRAAVADQYWKNQSRRRSLGTVVILSELCARASEVIWCKPSSGWFCRSSAVSCSLWNTSRGADSCFVFSKGGIHVSDKFSRTDDCYFWLTHVKIP